MTYPNTQESTMEQELPQPAWLKILRYLVFGLIIVSILAMLTVIWAAFQITSKTSTIELPTSITLPNGDAPVSITTLSNGDYIIVHSSGEMITMFGADGEIKSKAQFE